MKNTLMILTFLFGILNVVIGQEKFAKNPLEAKFITKDFERFWYAFDEMDKTSENPFEVYLKNASEGFSPLVGYFDSKTLYQTVQKRKEDYLTSRNVLDSLSGTAKEI